MPYSVLRTGLGGGGSPLQVGRYFRASIRPGERASAFRTALGMCSRPTVFRTPCAPPSSHHQRRKEASRQSSSVKSMSSSTSGSTPSFWWRSEIM
jgi:hypothetical protein